MSDRGMISEELRFGRGFVIFFTAFVCIYIAIFIFISNETNIYNISPDINNDRFFSMDDIYYSVKIYNEEMDLSTRIVKHPLLIAGASVFTKVERAFFSEISLYNHYRIIVIFQMLCFFISLIYMYKTLREHFEIKERYILLTLLIYAVSAPALIYTFIVESYIISAMVLIMSYYYILKGKKTASVILGVLAAGVTITNAFIWAVMTVFSKMNFKKKLLSIIAALVIFSVLVFITPAGKIFYDNLISVFISSPQNYRDHFSIMEALKRTAFIIFGSTFFCIDTAEQSPFGEFAGNAISFTPSANIAVIIMMFIWILILAYSIFNNFKNRRVIIAAAVLIFNILLHGVLQYGMKEGFLYSLHHLYAQLIIAAALFTGDSGKIKKCSAAALAVFAIFMIYINIQGFSAILEFAKRF